jgi:tRNA pseudouridine38-40 synthase
MTIILQIEYDGTNYSGWQIQNNAITVQGEIEKSVNEILGKAYSVIAAGRTDAGVHALRQTAHIKDAETHIPENKLPNAINSKLPSDIRVKNAVYYPGEFHSRFDATGREYIYKLNTKYNVFERNYVSFVKFPISSEKLIKSAELFLGSKDYTTFSKYNADQTNPVCHLSKCKWDRISETQLQLTIKSSHFLYGMVRSVVGASIDIARGKRTTEEIIKAFDKKDRNFNSPLAPPQGLYLSRIFYKQNLFRQDQ